MQRRAFAKNVAMLGALALSRPALALTDTPVPQMRRRYVEGPFGQLHFRVANPGFGQFSAPPLVLLHQTALSGRMFDHILPHLATNRFAIAIDTPGYGESDRPLERPDLAAYGDAIINALLPHYEGPFDLLGYHTGAAIAASLAARRADVRRLVLFSMPYFGTERREELLAQLLTPREEGNSYTADGSHLAGMWQGSFGARAPQQRLDRIADLVSEKTRAGRFGHWALLSAMEQDLSETLASINKPTLVYAPYDGLQEQSRAASEIIKGAEFIEFPELAYGLFDTHPAHLARSVNAFLTR